MGFLDRLLGHTKIDANEVPGVPALPDFEAERRRARAAGSFRGHHFTEWAPEVDRLRAEGKLHESLASHMSASTRPIGKIRSRATV